MHKIIKTIDQVVQVVKGGEPRLCTFMLYDDGVVEVDLVGRHSIRISQTGDSWWAVEWTGLKSSQPAAKIAIGTSAKAAFQMACETFWRIAPWQFEVGQVIGYMPVGKVARMEGKEGKQICGTIIEVDEANEMLKVAPLHRQKPTARFNGLAQMVSFDEVLPRGN